MQWRSSSSSAAPFSNTAAHLNNSIIDGANLIICGDCNTIAARHSKVHGNHNVISGACTDVNGDHNRITCRCTTTRGNSNSVNGDCVTVEGNINRVTGLCSTVCGNGNTAQGDCASVHGDRNACQVGARRRVETTTLSRGRVRVHCRDGTMSSMETLLPMTIIIITPTMTSTTKQCWLWLLLLVAVQCLRSSSQHSSSSSSSSNRAAPINQSYSRSAGTMKKCKISARRVSFAWKRRRSWHRPVVENSQLAAGARACSTRTKEWAPSTA